MADHPDPFGPGEPSPLPEGEFKSDFFGSMGAAGRPAEPDTLASYPQAPPDPPARHPVFPVVLGVAFLALIVVAAVVSALPSSPPATAAALAAAPDAGTAARESDVKTLSESLAGEIAGLSKKLQDLDARLAALPKPDPSPDLAPLNAKLAALARAVDAVGPLAKKVDDLGERLDGLNTSVKSVQDDTGSLKDQVASLRDDAGTPAAATRDAPRPPVNVNVEGQSFSQAVELFKAGRYKEANQVLKTTEENDPKDARVWYYAALSAGLATNQWLGDTQKLVMKGVEREKAGTPSPKEIDDEFSRLPASQQNWLAAYRKLARK